MKTLWRSALLHLIFVATAAAQPAVYPPQIDLIDLLPSSGADGSLGIIFEGLVDQAHLGNSITSIGDVNGDGFDDIAIADSPIAPLDPTIYVIFGPSPLTAAFDLTTINGSNGFTITAVSPGDTIALNPVPGSGDVNGDGFDDLLIGGLLAGGDLSGRVYVVFGGPTVGSTGTVDLSTLSGPNGYVILGALAGERARHPGFAGDLDGDGHGDIAIGTDQNDKVGDAYVVFGGPLVGALGSVDLALLTGPDGFEIDGLDDINSIGSDSKVDGAGDVNGDGFDDLVIGSRRAFTNGWIEGGKAFVVFGSANLGSGGLLDLATLNGSNGFQMNGGGGDNWNVGYTVAGVGDVDNDGFDDFVVGSSIPCPAIPCPPGQAYLVWGASSVGSSGLIELVNLLPANGGDGSVGAVILGDAGTGGSLGETVDGCDWNHDGFRDLVLGAAGGDAGGGGGPPGSASKGDVRVVFGRPGLAGGGQFDTALLLPAAGGDGSQGVVLPGAFADDLTGTAVSCAGDFDGDGFSDIMAAGDLTPVGLLNRAGRVYVVYGLAPPAPPLFPPVVSLSDVATGMGGFAVLGIGPFDESGYSVARAGDLNDDGLGDVIIGAPFHPNGPQFGHAYVVFGDPDIALASPIQASLLDGSNGFRIRGRSDADRLGYDVAFAGDVNADGIDDVLLGSPQAGSLAENGRGESFVVFGASGIGAGGLLDVSTLNGTNGFSLVGIDAFDQSGWSVSGGFDLDNDAVADVVVGAPDADPLGLSGKGESYVVFGGAGIGAGGAVQLDSLIGSNGFTINGVDINDQSGWTVSSGGDVNGDGVDDLIIGARRGDPGGNTDAGETYVVFGSATGFGASLDLSTLNGSNGFVINGIAVDDFSSRAAAGAGDVNADGFDDVLIGAEFADPLGRSAAGEAYVVFGGASVAPGGSFDLSSLDGSNGFRMQGLGTNRFLGNSVAGAGDVNSDGIADLIVGSRGGVAGPFAVGVAYVIFGQPDLGETGSFNLTSLNGYNGFMIAGIDSNDFAGWSVAAAGDVNGDCSADVIVGATGGDPNGSQSGETYVVFGRGGVCTGAPVPFSSAWSQMVTAILLLAAGGWMAGSRTRAGADCRRPG